MYPNSYRPSGFNLLPQVVKNLLIINGIFFLATYVFRNQGLDLVDLLGLHYFQSEKFRAYQFITYMFMHGGTAHLLFNMFALWMFGQAVENVWGPKRFLKYFIITGLGAAVLHYVVVYFEIQPGIDAISAYLSKSHPTFNDINSLMNSEALSRFWSDELDSSKTAFVSKFNALLQTDSAGAFAYSKAYMSELKTAILNAPVVVGASGAIFGLLLAYGMLFPNSLIFIYFVLPIRAKYFVIIYGALELFSGILNVPGDNVAHFAHLGGLLFGFLLIQYWKREDRNRHPFNF
jgi:membrane associated rhomboid family serine protease